jgi:hypothetical protein
MVDDTREFVHLRLPGQDEPALARRLQNLADLEPGWHDGEGEKISAMALKVAREIALSTADAGFSPRLYPTVDGGVSAEWSSPSREVSVEIAPAGSLYVHDMEVETEATREFDVDESGRALRLVTFSRLAG